MLIDRAQSRLILIDIQARIMPAVEGAEALLKNALILRNAAAELGVPIVITEQYPQGLGGTLPEVTEGSDAPIFEKREFSAAANAGFADFLKGEPQTQMILAGVEAHVCVLQTALDLIGAGYEVFLVADAVASRKAESRAIALERMRAAGVTIVTTEMVAFEWLRTAADPAFRTVSRLVK